MKVTVRIEITDEHRRAYRRAQGLSGLATLEELAESARFHPGEVLSTRWIFVDDDPDPWARPGGDS